MWIRILQYIFRLMQKWKEWLRNQRHFELSSSHICRITMLSSLVALKKDIISDTHIRHIKTLLRDNVVSGWFENRWYDTYEIYDNTEVTSYMNTRNKPIFVHTFTSSYFMAKKGQFLWRVWNNQVFTYFTSFKEP